jgi:hypothetical protein
MGDARPLVQQMIDLVLLTVEIAFKAYEERQLSKKDLTRTIETCINVVSIENGYLVYGGMPR